MFRYKLCFFPIVLATFICVSPFAAQVSFKDKPGLWEDDPNLRKVSTRLMESRRLVRLGFAPYQLREMLPKVRFRDSWPEIEIRFRSLDTGHVAELERIGVEVLGVYYQYARVIGSCDPEMLAEISAIPEVATVHPNYAPILRVGQTTSQADESIRANLARATFGVNGSGVSVGVISDSFHDNISGGSVSGTGCDRVLTGSDTQLSGDLPASVTIVDNGVGGASDEGRAMAELIHDLAPGADIMFQSGWESSSAMASGIGELVSCGADVIVDDLGYLGEPFFQDGIVAQAAQDAVDAGVPFFSAAGNQGSVGIDEFYQDVSPPLDGGGIDLHDFGGGDAFATVELGAHCGAAFILQWNEPFDGILGPGASSDLDLGVCTAPDINSCAGSVDVQGCGFGPGVQSGDPWEGVYYLNDSAVPATVHLAVDHYCGSPDVRFRVVVFPDCPSSTVFQPGIFTKEQIFGHPAAEGVEAVGAVFYGEIDSGGSLVGGPEINVEYFSSLGGELPFYFDGAGNPLPGAPVTRFKPEIASPDGTNTTFFGFDIEPDGYPNFFGTSASAPHAAAVAALMLDANPSLNPAQIREAVAITAWDIEAPGIDPLSGAGLIDAYDAVSEVIWGIKLEVGQVTVSHNWKTVNLDQSYFSPVVISGPLSFEGSHPSVVRIRSVTSSSFQIRVQEWDYLDGSHAAEKVSYLVVEAGHYNLPDGTVVAAGELTTDKTGIDNFISVPFSSAFGSPPVLLTTVGSFNGIQAVTTRLRNVSASGFQVVMQEEEGNDQTHISETIFWVAWTAASGLVAGLDYDSGTVSVNHQFSYIPGSFTQLKVEEEQSLDQEISHVLETVGYVWLEDAGKTHLLADMQTKYGGDPAALRWRHGLSLGRAEVAVSHNWKSVALPAEFVDPVIVAKPLSYKGPSPAVVRMRNVGASSFDIRAQEWDYLDGAHAVEQASYLVLEAGRHVLPDGKEVEAGTFSFSNTGMANWVWVPFESAFASTPIVVCSISTFNGAQAVTTRLRNITADGFEVVMQEEEGNDQHHLEEVVSYIAWEAGAGSVGGLAYEVGTRSNVTDAFTGVSFGASFFDAPLFVADLQTANGGDPANLRYTAKNSAGIEIKVTEEQSVDAELTHVAEKAGYISIGP